MNGIIYTNRRGCRCRKRFRGFTLLELIVASTSGAILLAGLSGSLYIASQGFDQNNTQVNQMTAQQVLGDLMGDLKHASSFSERTAKAVTFTVPDRTGDNLPETIRYAWGGAAGSPLTYEYNGSAAVTLASGVQNFNLSYLTRRMPAAVLPPPEGANKLLLVVTYAWSPNSQETARQSLFESWGYTVTRIDDGASQASYDTKLAENHVVYVSENIDSSSVGTKLTGATIGVVNEEAFLTDELGFSSEHLFSTDTTIEITDKAHYITDTFDLGPLEVVLSDQPMTALAGTLALSLRTLGERGADCGLGVLVSGATAYDDSTVAGRRVALPWGGDSFDIGALTDDGRTMLRKSIEWAAGAGDETSASVIFEEFTEAKESSDVESIDLSIPAGVSTGDLLIAAVATDGENAVNPGDMSMPSGWTQLYAGMREGRVTFAVWWKLAEASEPLSVTISWEEDQQAYAWMMRFTGHDLTNPIHAFATGTENATNPTSPAVTTSVANTMILRLGGFDDDDITVDDTGLAGHTTITMDESSGGNGTVSGGAAFVGQMGAGDSGTSTFSLTAKEQAVGVTISIAPDPEN